MALRRPLPADAALPGEAFWGSLGWQPAPGQLELLVALQEQLGRWNARVNLTRLVEGADYWIGQVYDSLWPLAAELRAEAAGTAPPLDLVDVGTGGGFPGLAVAIALPSARLTLVDSVGRKVEAVRAMAQALGLERRVDLRCERIERTGHSPDCRGRFDRALARAVAAAPVVAEYLVPLLRPGGQALLYRGQWGPEEGRALERAAAILGARVERCERRELPAGRGVRHVLRLQPQAPCPAAFPRGVGIPRRQPISDR